MESQGHERTNQKQRTRSALLSAAAALLSNGLTPTVAEVAEAAGISRATAYRYFPSQDLMLVEAALDAAVPDLRLILNANNLSESVEERLDALVVAIQTWVADHERAFRTLLKLSVDPAGGEAGQRRRAGRRVGWITDLLAPIRPELDPRVFDRLVSALAMCIGIEAHVALEDVCGLASAEAQEVSRWAAQALLRDALSTRNTKATEPTP